MAQDFRNNLQRNVGTSPVDLVVGGNKTATNGTFTVTFPDPATPANAIISMS